MHIGCSSVGWPVGGRWRAVHRNNNRNDLDILACKSFLLDTVVKGSLLLQSIRKSCTEDLDQQEKSEKETDS